jgi:GH43 family beta-xylosidase
LAELRYAAKLHLNIMREELKNPEIKVTPDLFSSEVISQTINNFRNPLLPSGADPFTVLHDGIYYYTQTAPMRDYIGLRFSESLPAIPTSEEKIIWRRHESGPCSSEVWAPEIHFIDGKWYIYFSACAGTNETHRMFVLESENENVLGPYKDLGQVLGTDDKWAIDGTVLEYAGKKYFVWSGWPSDTDGTQNLYIAELLAPNRIGEKVLISSPSLPWEFAYHGEQKIEIGVNEGPAVLKRDDKVFIVFSANGSWTDNYQLGMLSLIGKDPLNPSSWKKAEGPVFSTATYGEESIFAPGHCSFVEVPSSKEHWMFFHAATTKGSGWAREVHAKPFNWSDGVPDFGQAFSRRTVLSFS